MKLYDAVNTRPEAALTVMARSSSGFIGKSIKLREATRLLKGNGTYVGDIRLPNMVQAAVLRSMHAHARIRSIDVTKAAKLDGVVLILTAEDIADSIAPFPASFEIHPTSWLEAVKPVLKGPRTPVLAQGKVRYVGECIVKAGIDIQNVFKARENFPAFSDRVLID